MDRFHFPVENQVFHSVDDEGRDLVDIDAARAEAGRAAGEILTAELAESDRIEFIVYVEDRQRRRKLSIRVQAVCEKLD